VSGTLTFGLLFAGIGGLDLAFERAGMRCCWIGTRIAAHEQGKFDA